MATKTTITISNIAGGDAREFAWTGALSSRAIRHARRCDAAFGGVLFAGDPEGAAAASDEWDRVREDEVAS